MLLNKNISPIKIATESAHKSQGLYHTFIQLDYNQPVTKPVDENNHASNRTDSLELQAKSLLNVWLNQRCSFLIQSEIFRFAGITSGSTQAKIKKYLLRKQLVREHKLLKGKSYLCILEPLVSAFKFISATRPKTPSKGGYLHSFVVYHLCEWAKMHGYLYDIEFMLTNGKAVDVLLRSTVETIMCEVAISKPFSKEIRNCNNNLNSELSPSEIWVIATDNKSKGQIEELIKKEKSLDTQTIKTKLAGEFIEYSSATQTSGGKRK